MVPIETVPAGTRVMNSAGVEAEVSSVRRRSYSGDMLKIVPVSAGNSFELTPEPSRMVHLARARSWAALEPAEIAVDVMAARLPRDRARMDSGGPA